MPSDSDYRANKLFKDGSPQDDGPDGGYALERKTASSVETPRQFVLVGVKNGNAYFGELEGDIASIDLAGRVDGAVVRLHSVQMCGGISSNVRTWLDLAARGPDQFCQISPPVSVAVIGEVRDILLCTDEAAGRWRECPWHAQTAGRAIRGING